jgi:hypothetical protein
VSSSKRQSRRVLLFTQPQVSLPRPQTYVTGFFKRDETTGEWRRLHDEELNDLYSSPNIIRVIKSRRMRWTRLVARMGKREVHTGFWWGDLREGDHLGDPGVERRKILKWIFKQWDGSMDWIEPAQDRDRWRAVVNAVMNLRVP